MRKARGGAGWSGLSRLSGWPDRQTERPDEQERRARIKRKSLKLAFWWSFGHRLEDGADLLLQGRQIPLHHSPDLSKINAEIVVDQDVAHFDDLGQGMSWWVFRKEGVSLLAASPMIWMWWIIQVWTSSSSSKARRTRFTYRSIRLMASTISCRRPRSSLIG